jgi:hypothetical protein
VQSLARHFRLSNFVAAPFNLNKSYGFENLSQASVAPSLSNQAKPLWLNVRVVSKNSSPLSPDSLSLLPLRWLGFGAILGAQY